MPSLVLPDVARPTNLVVSAGSRGRVLTSDVYDICHRVAELDDALYIVELDHDDPRPYRYIVMERCADGVDRMALRVKAGELDGRVIEKLRYQLGVPFRDRVAKLEREGQEWEAKHREEESDRLYESIGGEFHRELERCGFISARPVSYPKKGIKST
jgi:hypothetical protein